MGADVHRTAPHLPAAAISTESPVDVVRSINLQLLGKIQDAASRRERFQMLQSKELVMIAGLPLLADMIRFMFAHEKRTAM
jgi:hypothetical protein